MSERKRERGERLSAAGRHSQRKKTARFFRSAQAVPEYLAALFADGVLSRVERRELCLQPLVQNRRRLTRRTPDRGVVHKGFGIQKIRVYETGKEHPHSKRIGEPGELFRKVQRDRRNFRHGRRKCIFICRIIASALFLPFELGAERRTVVRISGDAAIRQAGMVTRDAIGKQIGKRVFQVLFAEYLRARRGMFDLFFAAK